MTIAAVVGEKVQYALEGSVFVAGAAIQWLRDEMKMIPSAADSEHYCLAVPDTGGVYLVPAFTGLGAPYWDPYARGILVGITRGTTRDHVVRATVESLAYQVHDLVGVMGDASGMAVNSLTAALPLTISSCSFSRIFCGRRCTGPGCMRLRLSEPLTWPGWRWNIIGIWMRYGKTGRWDSSLILHWRMMRHSI